MSVRCETPSVTPLWVTIAIGTASFVMLIITVIYSMKHLKKVPPSSKRSAWDKASGFCKKFKLCAKDIWGRKSVYLPLITHLSDTTTDFFAVIEFGIVAANSDPDECGVNVWYLFYLSIISMLLYRFISGYIMYRLSRSYFRVLLQFFDLELYRILYISHKYGLTGKSSPQRLISVLEAVFEAAPQSVIQMVFLMFTGNKSSVIIVSAVFSFLNLTLSMIGDDTKMFGFEWGENFEQLILLYIYRFMDIPSKLLVYVFMWYFVSGEICIIYVMINISVAVLLFFVTRKKTDALLFVVALPFSFGDEDLWCCCDVKCNTGSWMDTILLFGVAECVSINVIIWKHAEIFNTDTIFITVLWIYCSIAMIVKLILFCSIYMYIQHGYNDQGQIAKSFMKKSKERTDVDTLVDTKKYLDAMELILFADSISSALTKTYGKAPGKTLLCVAFDCDNITMEQEIRSVFDKTAVKHEDPCETALIAAIKGKKRENVETLLQSPHVNWDYIWISAETYGSYDALDYAKYTDLTPLIWNKVKELIRMNGDDKSLKNIFRNPSLLAQSIEDNEPECFQMILDNVGLDIFEEKEKEYETALMMAAKDHADLEYAQTIMNAPGFNVDYIKKIYSDKTVFYDAIWYNNVEIIKLIGEYLNRVCGEKEIADILNNTCPGSERTALHCVCYLEKGLKLFELMYNLYPVNFRKDALSRKKSGKYTVLDLCTGKYENKYIAQFIKNHQ